MAYNSSGEAAGPILDCSMDRILVIEDDRAIQRALSRLFTSEGYILESATDGTTGLAAFRASPPALVILDLKLPGVSGKDICREIKQARPSMPVVVLSAIDEEVDKVLMLELGADDYVTKPFSPKELLARVRAVLRRARGPESLTVFGFDDISVDFSRLELTRAGQAVSMTPHEFKALKYFVENPQRVISREELLNQVWGYHSYPSTRTVDNHILKLRQKLEKDPANPTHFRTIHGAGYKFVP